MSKANDNFDHLIRDKYGHKEVKGTYHAINKLEERIEKLDKTLEEFMEKWVPEVQRRIDERDHKWDEMIRVLTVQSRNKK